VQALRTDGNRFAREQVLTPLRIAMKTIRLPERAFGADDIEGPTRHCISAANTDFAVGHSKRAQVGHFSRAPRFNDRNTDSICVSCT
jgi:hypothetical protein